MSCKMVNWLIEMPRNKNWCLVYKLVSWQYWICKHNISRIYFQGYTVFKSLRAQTQYCVMFVALLLGQVPPSNSAQILAWELWCNTYYSSADIYAIFILLKPTELIFICFIYQENFPVIRILYRKITFIVI